MMSLCVVSKFFICSDKCQDNGYEYWHLFKDVCSVSIPHVLYYYHVRCPDQVQSIVRTSTDQDAF